MKWLVIVASLAIAGACDQSSESPKSGDTPLSASEIKRGQDACRVYVDKVCSCAKTMPDMVQVCGNARALPEALDLAAQVATNASSGRRDVQQSNLSVRAITKGCIEKAAALPGSCL